MKQVPKYTRWNEEDRRSLALIVKRGLDKKATIQNACAYAAKKLGRTRQACEFQWHHWIKDSLDTYLIPTVAVNATRTEAAPVEFRKDWDAEVAEPKTWPEEKGERIAVQEPGKNTPTIEVHSAMNSEVCEIIEHVGGTIIARASRGIIIVIKNDN